MDEKKEEGKKQEVINPEPDGTCYFLPTENCTVLVAEDYDRETKQHKKHHFVTVKKGVPFATNKKHEIDLCKKRSFRQIRKPKPRPKDDELFE